MEMQLGIVNIEVDSSYDTKKVANIIKDLDGIKDLYEVSGGYDIMAIFYSRDVESLNKSIDRIRRTKGVKDTDTKIVLKDYEIASKK